MARFDCLGGYGQGLQGKTSLKGIYRRLRLYAFRTCKTKKVSCCWKLMPHLTIIHFAYIL